MASLDQIGQGDDYRKLLAAALMRQGIDTSPVKHWTQGAARMAQALVGSMWGNQLQQEQAAAMNWNPLAGVPGGSADASPASVPPMGNKVAEALATKPPYGQNMMQTDQGGSVPVPPSNPLGQADPQFRTQFADLRSALADRGVDINAPEAGSIGNVRTPQQQQALYAQGRTAPGPIVTGTLNSNHLTGNALDVVPLNTDEKTVGKMVTALTQTDPRFANMRSGATFKNLYDPLHVERLGTQVAGPPQGPADIPPNAQPTAQVGQPPAQMAQGAPQQPITPDYINRLEAGVNAALADPNTPLAIKKQAYAYKQWILQHRMEQSMKYGPEAIAGEASKAGAIKSAQQKAEFSPEGIAGAARLEGAKEEAALPAKAVLKGSPTFEDKQKLEQKDKALGTLSDTVSGIAKNYVNLDKMGGIVNSDKGTMSNIQARAASSAAGQEIGQAIGTKESSLRQEIINSRPQLINAIRQATQMGARGLDSNVELSFYMQQTSDPTRDIWSNLAALDKLDKAYGLGGSLKKVLTPEQYARVEKGSAALEHQFKASQGGSDPLGIR